MVFEGGSPYHCPGWSPCSLPIHPPGTGVIHVQPSVREGYMHRCGRHEEIQILCSSKEKLTPSPNVTGTKKETLHVKVTQITRVQYG